MKRSIKLLMLGSLAFVFVFLSVTPFTGCKKTVTVHDTTTVTKHDTTIVNKHDTTVVTDTLYDITSGLVAWYNFNNGTLKDSSGFNNHITFNNATPAADRFGRANNAYSFNGSSSYMQVNNSSSLNVNSITMFAIIKVNGFYSGPCHGNQILGKGYPDATNGTYAMRFADFNCSSPIDSAHEKFTAYFGDNSVVGSAAGTNIDTVYINKSTWYVLAYTYDGVTSRFYINGVLKGSLQKTAPGFTANSQPLLIGVSGDTGYPYWFNGIIDEIRIYNRPLGANAVAQLSKLNN